MSDTNLALLVGEVNGKVDILTDLMTDTNTRVQRLEQEVSASKARRGVHKQWWATIGAAAVAAASAVVTVGSHFLKG